MLTIMGSGVTETAKLSAGFHKAFFVAGLDEVVGGLLAFSLQRPIMAGDKAEPIEEREAA